MPFLRAVLLVALLMLTFVAGIPASWLCGRLNLPTAWIARLFCRGALALLGVRVDVAGAGRTGPRLIAANHVSWIDVLALASVEPLCFLAKRDVADWPLIGRLAREHGTLFIDRKRRRTIPAANRAMAARLVEGRSVLLFPEGTTYDGARRGPYLTSHLACLRDQFALATAGVRPAVQPVAVAYSDPVAAWVGDATLLPHLWAVLKHPGLTCALTYGSPIEVEQGFDRKRLGRELAATVEVLLHNRHVAAAADSPAMTKLTPAASGSGGAIK